MRTLVTLALVLAACGRSDRRGPPAEHDASPSSAPPGPDAVVLRVPRAGGVVRAYAYARLDSALWTSTARAPAVDRVLAFDAVAGSVAIVDSRGLPGRIDLRSGAVSRASKTKLASLTSADGSAIYGVAPGGAVTRLTPSGTWTYKPPSDVRELFPAPDGSLLVLADRGDAAALWRMRPPETKISDSAVLPRAERAVSTQVGDRVYFTVDSGLVGVRSRDLTRLPPLRFEHRVRTLAPTPSGDRLYVATESTSALGVVDRYSEKVVSTIALPGRVSELRMDPLGRYVLARPASGDSAWVIAIGTDRVIGSVRTSWRADLPFVAPDGAVALAAGSDVRFVDGETLRPGRTVAGGAKDFWYVFAWDGFRPRAPGLDEPVTFAEPDSAEPDTTTRPIDSVFASPVFRPESTEAPGPPSPVPDSATPRPTRPPASVPASPARPGPSGFIVQFAAVTSEQKAREAAATIRVGDQSPRVIASNAGAGTIYRVVFGPYATKAIAERVGREARHDFWVYEATP